MANQIVLADTSILIDYFRKKDKSKSKLIELIDNKYDFCISSVTEYEIYSGATGAQIDYWQAFLQRIAVFPFDQASARIAVEINKKLKKKNKQIDTADLFIAATAICNGFSLATLNKKHFDRIDGLIIIA